MGNLISNKKYAIQNGYPESRMAIKNAYPEIPLPGLPLFCQNMSY